MPYKPSQCRALGAKESKGEKTPDDWHDECRGKKQGKMPKKTKRAPVKRKRGGGMYK